MNSQGHKLMKRVFQAIFCCLLFSAGIPEFTNIIRVPAIKKLNKIFGTPRVEDLNAYKKLNYSDQEVALGKALFFDKQLSKNKNISCASCHKPDLGFGSELKFSIGTNGDTLDRHSPSIFNLLWNKDFFWDGRASSLEEQLEAVLTSPVEMDIRIDTLIERLNNDVFYTKQFGEIYGPQGITRQTIFRVVIAFESTELMSNNAPFDRYMAGNRTALNEEELKGLNLFLGKGKCVTCHKGPNFSDNEFHNVGVITDDLGRQPFDRVGVKKEFEMRPYPFFATFKAFKTPSLRDVEHTAPYFHNGSEATLTDVIKFYNKGGHNPDRTGVAKEISPIGFSDDEISQLEMFLKTLSSPKASE